MEEAGKRTVMVAGRFDPCHDGHIDHIRKAAVLGDYLVIVTHPDDVIDRLKAPHKHNVPLWARIAILQGLLLYYQIPGSVLVSQDNDGKVAKTIRLLRPQIFAKGGDRTPDNMPREELEACADVGCQIVYGAGDLLNSSTKIMENG